MRMKALKLFTVNSPRNGAIIHGDDRKEADLNARFPDVDPRDAEFLERNGYAKPYSGNLSEEDGVGDGTGPTVDERAGNMVEDNADAEASVDATTALSTRDTTAFERPIEEIAGGGSARSIDVVDTRTAPAADDAPTSGKRASTRSAGKSE